MKNYFKKFSIMFVMAFAIMLGCCTSVFATDDGVVGTSNLNNTTENSAKIGDVLNLPESGWKRYDDTNSNISYIGTGWSAYTNSTEYNGSTMYTYSPNGSSVRFKFTGSKIRIINPHNPAQNTSEDVYIDGVKVNNHSLTGSNLRQVLVYEYKNLGEGEHYFEYKFVGTSITAFDAVDIDKNGILKPYNENIESISLNKPSMSLTVGDLEQLTATTTSSAVGVTWSSSDTSIATVDSTGKVTAIKEGQATITAATTDGLIATCAVTVTPKVTEPNPEPTNIVNIARAKGDNTNNASGGVSIIFKGVAEAQLSVVKTVDVQSVYVGDTFTYTIVVTNISTKTAKTVVVSDNAPNHIDFTVSGITTTQGKVDPSSTSKNIIVNVGDILPSGTVTIKIPVTVIL